MLKRFAEELKSKREESGISLEDIAQKIRIDKKFLYNFEDGNFSFLPDLYIKAYLKEYAKEIGLDPNFVLKQFSQAKEGKNLLEETTQPEPTPSVSQSPQYSKKYVDTDSLNNLPDESPEANTTTSYKNSLLIYGFLALTALIFIVYFIFFYNKPTEIVRETPFEEILEEKQKLNEPIEQTEINTVDSLELNFFARDSSWIKVGIDNSPAKEYFLFPKRSIVLKGLDSFNLTIGNYKSVQLSLDGTPLVIENQPGRVARVTVDRNGIR